MEIKSDKIADTKYIRLKKGKVVKTEAKESWLLFDYDKHKEVIGVEILEASKHLISLHTIKNKLFSVLKNQDQRSRRDASEMQITELYEKGIRNKNLWFESVTN